MSPADPRIAGVRFTPAPEHDHQKGLLGYASFLVGNGLRVDGVCLRRTKGGRLALSFPSRRDRYGRTHPYLRPICDDARRSIEDQVFAALGLDGEVCP